MNKTQFIKEISKESNLTQKDCKLCLDVITSLISKALKDGDNISLVGFGKFEAKKRNARTFFNPKTKKSINMPESVIPSFKAGKSLKDAVNV